MKPLITWNPGPDNADRSFFTGTAIDGSLYVEMFTGRPGPEGHEAFWRAESAGEFPFQLHTGGSLGAPAADHDAMKRRTDEQLRARLEDRMPEWSAALEALKEALS